MTSLSNLTLALYLGIAPVYWWPSVSIGGLNLLKFSMISLAVLFVWIRGIALKRIQFPAGIIGPFGLLLLGVACVPGMVQTPLDVSILTLKDVLLAFVMLWTMYIHQRCGADTSRLLLASAVIVAGHCLIVISSKVLGVPTWLGPPEYEASELWVSGFSSARTGWANGTALYVGVFAMLFQQERSSMLMKIMAVGGIAAIVASQVVVSGRGGLLAALMCLVLTLVRRHSRRWLVVIVIVGGVAVAGAGVYIQSQLRLDIAPDQSVNEGELGRLDTISSGRIGSTIAALEMIAEHPITGLGLGKGLLGKTEIHDLWLRLAVEGGILLPTMLAAIIFQIIRRVAANRRFLEVRQREVREAARALRARPDYQACLAILLAGLVVTMIEPRFLIGAFQLSALWWAVAGIGIVRHLRATR